MQRAARSEIGHPELPHLARHRAELRELSHVQTPIFLTEGVSLPRLDKSKRKATRVGMMPAKMLRC
jgi:hypothetical protein